MSIEVRDLRDEDVPAAIGVLARGMRDNPLHVAVYGYDPDFREQAHGKLMTALFRHVRTQQPLVAVEEATVVGVTGVAPLGTCQPSLGARLRFLPVMFSLGAGTAARVNRWLAEWAKRDPDEPHVHLGPVAVDRGRQGQGIGSLMLAEHTLRLDAAGEVGYLETDKRENVRFYEKAGFEVIEEAEVLSVPNWFMRRPPASP